MNQVWEARKGHWERIYHEKDESEVSWHQDRPQMSLALIGQAGTAPDEPIIDIGGGAAHLVDALLDRGHSDVTVLDLAGSALAQARERLGERAASVAWIEADVTAWEPPRCYRLWHDRAVFHFLTEAGERTAYLERLRSTVPAGGHVIIASFGPDGPDCCSGLPVVRYTPEGLEEALGTGFELCATRYEAHRTPAGKPQQFVGALFRRT
ncbi:class I SAM-dependent methyltransferase [Thiohalorhabdus methylotrophus]|uniref:Trans-aconitate 2-methyltransferase n=1 Tax=Thiohalorhabdus methylotrophus TaxID=3242694 RepID=A0ABV4TTH4_9GAMM